MGNVFFFRSLAFIKEKKKKMNDASPPSSSSRSPAPQRQQFPWSTSSPPSPIELWHVARGAAAARTALEEEGEGAEEEWAEEDGAEEGDEGAAFETRSCSASPRSLRRRGDDDKEGTRWSLEDGILLERCSGEEEPGKGEEEEGGEGRGCSSPGATWPRQSRRRCRRSLSRSRCLLAEEEPRDGERLEDLIDSMLAMTVRVMRQGRECGREREETRRRKTSGLKKGRVKFLHYC